MKLKNLLSGSHLSRNLVTCLSVALMITLANHRVSAQDEAASYKTIPVPEAFDIPNKLDMDPSDRAASAAATAKRTAASEVHKRITAWLNGEGAFNQQEFEGYFTGYYFANMTQLSPRKMGEYGKLRNEFFRFYMAKASGQARGQLLQWAFNTMSPVAQENYHPAARVNALLLIGNLDSQRGSRRSNGAAPVPYAQALPYLLEFVEDDSIEDYLKIAAMVGIQRHATLQPNGAEKDRVARLMRDLINAQPAENAASTEQDATYWLHRRAIQTLGCLRDSANADLLVSIFVDKNKPFWVRLDAIHALQKLDIQDANQIDSFLLSKEVAEFIAVIAREDIAYVDESIRSILEVAFFLDGVDPQKTKKKASKKQVSEGMFSPEAGRGANDNKKEVKEILPVFRRKIVRQRIKTALYIVNLLVAGEEESDNLFALIEQRYGADSEEMKFVSRLRDELRRMMGSVDIVDIRGRRKKDDDDEAISRAEKLKVALDEGALALEALLEEFAEDEAAEAEADTAADNTTTGEASGDETSSAEGDDSTGSNQ